MPIKKKKQLKPVWTLHRAQHPILSTFSLLLGSARPEPSLLLHCLLTEAAARAGVPGGAGGAGIVEMSKGTGRELLHACEEKPIQSIPLVIGQFLRLWTSMAVIVGSTQLQSGWGKERVLFTHHPSE